MHGLRLVYGLKVRFTAHLTKRLYHVNCKIHSDGLYAWLTKQRNIKIHMVDMSGELICEAAHRFGKQLFGNSERLLFSFGNVRIFDFWS